MIPKPIDSKKKFKLCHVFVMTVEDKLRPVSLVVDDTATGAGGLGFDSQVYQIGQ